MKPAAAHNGNVQPGNATGAAQPGCAARVRDAHRDWGQEGLGAERDRWCGTPAQPEGLRTRGSTRRPLLAAGITDGCSQQSLLWQWPRDSHPRGHSFPLRPQSWSFGGDFHQL